MLQTNSTKSTLTEQDQVLIRRTLAYARPPKEVRLSAWAEQHFVIPATQRARPGKYRNWPYMVEILDAIGDPSIERVTVRKSARVGFSKGLAAAVVATAAIDPCDMIVLMPTEEDARGMSIDEIEPAFGAGPELRSLIHWRRGTGRTNLIRKELRAGGSIKILAARAPRQLRRHGAKKLFIDEADAMEITSEGDPITLAEKRTMAHAGRKIVLGSTPTEEDISVVDQRYRESDMRIFEVPCPKCGGFNEIVLSNIQVPEDEAGRKIPEEAYYKCPHCDAAVEEKSKPWMVARGRWRKLRPEVQGHAGFALNAFVSLLPNAAWGKLMAEWFAAKRAGPAQIQVFVNTIEGRGYRSSVGSLDAGALASRVEPFGLQSLPPEVLLITAGADVQDDRIEITFVGWPPLVPVPNGRSGFGQPFVLGHLQVDGRPKDPNTWAEFSTFLTTRWRHPNGWQIGVDACAIDAGDGEHTQAVYDFCSNKLSRRIYAVKGAGGARPIWKQAQKVKGANRLFIIGTDQLKLEIMERLAAETWRADGTLDPMAIRLSHDLPEQWFDQVTGERRAVRYVRNRTIVEFQPRRRGQRVEALDCLVYAFAVRHAPGVRVINLIERAARTPTCEASRPAPSRRPKGAAEWAAFFNG